MNRNDLNFTIALATANGPGNTQLRNAAIRRLRYEILPRIILQGQLPALRQQMRNRNVSGLINRLSQTPEVQAALILLSLKNRR